MTRKQITQVLTQIAFRRYRQMGPTFAEVDLGYHGRVDLICLHGFNKDVSLEQFEFRIGEVKSCRSDFLSDTKWRWYCQHPAVDRMEFLSPDGVITLDDLQGFETIGLRILTSEQLQQSIERMNQGYLDLAVSPRFKTLRRARILQHSAEERIKSRMELLHHILIHATRSENEKLWLRLQIEKLKKNKEVVCDP